MKVFVGFGYNERDQWIEAQVFPILLAMGFSVVDGRDMHGQILQPAVESRIDQSDAAIGFFTLREGQEDADYNSHLWVRDEMIHANAKGKPLIPIREDGVKFPEGLFGNRQFILLRQTDRLGCVVDLVRALGRRNIRRLRLDPETDELRRSLQQWRRSPGFGVRYRTQDETGLESLHREGRLDQIDQGFYLNVSDIPKRAYVEVDGVLNGVVAFTSGWVSADAVQVRIA